MAGNLLDSRHIDIADTASRAPGCTPGCPLNIDARSLVEFARRGDFKGVMRHIAMRSCFPGILASICDAPCEGSCNRKKIDGAVRIGELEKAAVRCGYEAPETGGHASRKKYRIAVVGGGLAGLAAAYLLARKGYQITLFEAKSRIGGKLNDYPADLLAPEILAAELGLAETAGVDIRLGSHIGETYLVMKLQDDYDAIFVAAGREDKIKNALKNIDPSTLQTRMAKVFAGGSIVDARIAGGAGLHGTPAGAMADALLAAESIDRYLKHLPLTAIATEEGTAERRPVGIIAGIPGSPADSAVAGPFFTAAAGLADEPGAMAAAARPTGIEPADMAPVHENGRLEPEEAIDEAMRCLLCKCTECMTACPYLHYFCQHPGTCARAVARRATRHRDNGDGRSPDFPKSCALCEGAIRADGAAGHGTEKTSEPALSNFACDSIDVRTTMRRKGCIPEARYDFRLRDMEFANSDEFRLLQHQRGTKQSRWLFFPGCSFSSQDPDEVEKIYDLLKQHLDDGVGIMLQCCGAPAEWAGCADDAREIGVKIKTDWSRAGEPAIIASCESCLQALRKAVPEASISVLGDLLASLPIDGSEWPLNADISKGEACSLEIADFSLRRENRRRLRKALAFGCSGRNAMNSDPRKPAVLYSEQITARMSDNLILKEDIEGAIMHAENSGRRILRHRTGSYIAGYRPAGVTYWVEYKKEKGRYVVLDCYAHRMQIEGMYPDEQDSDGTYASSLAMARNAYNDGESGCEAPYVCMTCHEGLDFRKIGVSYLGMKFPADMLACPICGQIYVSPELAEKAMKPVERKLEEEWPDIAQYMISPLT